MLALLHRAPVYFPAASAAPWLAVLDHMHMVFPHFLGVASHRDPLRTAFASRSEPERFARERRAYQEAQHRYATLLHTAKRSGM